MSVGADLRVWLGEGDPAVRWRLLDNPAAADRERARVATEGWGRRLLAEQAADGGWGDGPYAPKWTSTHYTLLHLLWLGLPPQTDAAHRGCAVLWQWQAGWRRPETCIASMLIRMTCYYGFETERLDAVVRDLLDQQLDDGGWNCATRTDRSKHSSFHTSIQALEALAAYARFRDDPDTEPAQQRGREFFLRHSLFRSHRTGEIAIRGSTRFPAFPEWHFDVLRGLEYFAAVDAPRDERLSDAVELVRRARRRDGSWSTYAPYPGRQWFPLEPPGPSRWNTLRATTVLAWWDSTPLGRWLEHQPELVGQPVRG